MCVSVIMAVHNDAAGVDRAIESIAAQTCRAWELIVVDDGSVDTTAGVLGRWAAADARIRVISNPTNRGLAFSLNRAWHAATCDLVARMDADDLAFPDRLERQVAYFQAHPEVDVVGTGVELIDERGVALGAAHRPVDHDILMAKIYKENPFIHPTVMMRRRFLAAAGGYDETLRRAQDYDLWLRTRHTARFANLYEPLVRYRVRRRPPVRVIAWGTFVLARSAWREGRLFSDGVYALRFLAASLLTRVGLRNSRLR